MDRLLSIVRLLPGFRSSGHPIRKVVAGLFYGFILIFLISLPFAPPSFSVTQNKVTTDSQTARISGHAADKASEILLIQNGQTLTKVKPDSQTKDFYIDLTNLQAGTHTYSLMACLTSQPDRCSSRQEITVTVNLGQVASAVTSVTPSPIPDDLVLITNVVDGDTVKLESGQIVRLIGINTPEVGNNLECFGNEASRKADDLLLNQYVRLEKDVSETDRYNRLLRYVWKGDELVNETLVAEGYAQVATYPPDVKYQDRFLAAQTQARAALVGLWSACISPTPKPITPKPTIKFSPTQIPVLPTSPPVLISNPNSSSSYICDCSKTCSNLSCAEAQYQLNVCGCSARDADHDGIACDSQCQ